MIYLPFAFDMSFYGLSLFAVFYGLDWIASVPPTVRLLNRALGTERTGIMVAWITVIHQIGGAAAAYLGGVLRIAFGTYLEAFMLCRADVHRGGADGAVYRRRAGAARAASGAIAGRVAADDGESAPVRGGDEPSAGANRALITASIMLATIMQGVDNTIANVALPHMQGSLSASQDQIAWVLTSYIVSAAIMMPLTGWLAGRFGIKYVFLISVLGFTLASALCGAATSLAAAGDLPPAAGCLRRRRWCRWRKRCCCQINPPERHGHAMAMWGMGVMLGPIIGPTLGGWLTDITVGAGSFTSTCRSG